MNTYRNKKTGVIIEIASEFGDTQVWEKISPAPATKAVKAEPKKEKVVEETPETPKKKATVRKAVKK